jgi:hypothetical protein
MSASTSYANVRYAHAPARALKSTSFAEKYSDRRRTGKTEKDRSNGNRQRNYERKQLRAQWYKDTSWNQQGNFPV